MENNQQQMSEDISTVQRCAPVNCMQHMVQMTPSPQLSVPQVGPVSRGAHVNSNSTLLPGFENAFVPHLSPTQPQMKPAKDANNVAYSSNGVFVKQEPSTPVKASFTKFLNPVAAMHTGPNSAFLTQHPTFSTNSAQTAPALYQRPTNVQHVPNFYPAGPVGFNPNFIQFAQNPILDQNQAMVSNGAQFHHRNFFSIGDSPEKK